MNEYFLLYAISVKKYFIIWTRIFLRYVFYFISIHAYFFLHYYNIKTDGIWLYIWDKMIAKEISFLESHCIYMSKIFFLLLVENADKISHIVIIVICVFVIFIITFWFHKRTKNLTCNKINILAFDFCSTTFLVK